MKVSNSQYSIISFVLVWGVHFSLTSTHPTKGANEHAASPVNQQPAETPLQLALALRQRPPEGAVTGGDRGRSWTHGVIMILPQVHLRKPCYDFTFL